MHYRLYKTNSERMTHCLLLLLKMFTAMLLLSIFLFAIVHGAIFLFDRSSQKETPVESEILYLDDDHFSTSEVDIDSVGEQHQEIERNLWMQQEEIRQNLMKQQDQIRQNILQEFQRVGGQ